MVPRAALLSLLSFMTLLVIPSTAQPQAVEKPKLKFTSDWTWQGPESPPALAADKGYFKDEGLDVTLDRGTGSTASAALVGSGAYDFGVGDISAMIVYNLQRADNRLLAVYVFGDQSPLSIVTLKGRGITKPKDLEGKRIVGGASGSAERLFPFFARAAGVDISTIKFLTVKEELREPMLVRGEADAMPGWASTGIMNLRALGVKWPIPRTESGSMALPSGSGLSSPRRIPIPSGEWCGRLIAATSTRSRIPWPRPRRGRNGTLCSMW
jgi:NitT/TauT family transport system substrate-binding protein